MATTTTYGTWARYTKQVSVAWGIENSLGAYADDFDLDALTSAYRDAINNALPDGVTLNGDEFYGPYYATDQNWDGYPTTDDGDLDLKTIIDGIDLWAIAPKFEKTA